MADTVCLLFGWAALIGSFLWRNTTNKDKETTIKLLFSALAAGIFFANIIHYWMD